MSNTAYKNEKPRMYFLMCAIMFVWGFDYVVVKNALYVLDPLTLVFFKYLLALFLVLAIRLKAEKGPLFKKKDVGLFIVCAIFGDILYHFSEYTAMSYMQVSLITIILCFVPVMSIAIERVMYKRRTSAKVVIGAFVCIFGVALIIGIDWDILLRGRLIGYLLAFACVALWNTYNFITAALHERYTTITLTLNQLICTCLLLCPYVLFNIEKLPEFTPVLIGRLLYLGLASAGAGFLIQVRSLLVLGPTVSALFSNFLPVTTTFFGWLFLGEIIAPIQFVGGAIVVAAGFYVIREKGKQPKTLRK